METLLLLLVRGLCQASDAKLCRFKILTRPHLGIPVLIHEYIRKFDIPVSDGRIAGVQVLHSRGNLGSSSGQ